MRESSKILPPAPPAGGKKQYWLSLEERLAAKNKPLKPLAGEFPSPPAAGESRAAFRRREFLQLMAAGLAFSAASCFRRPSEAIVPYVQRPEDILPGEANFYASSYFDGFEGFSIVVKTVDGRPIKVEGNREAALLNAHGLSPSAHGHLLSLYDPERIKGPKKNLFNRAKTHKETINISYEKLDKALSLELQKGQLALLMPRLPSPSLQSLLARFGAVFPFKRYVWDPLSMEAPLEAARLSYGQAAIPSYNLGETGFILSVGSDFLASTELQRQFAFRRKPDKNMLRLAALEPLMSLTGANADERERISASAVFPALCALALSLSRKTRLNAPSGAVERIKAWQPAIDKLPIASARFDAWAEELLQKKGLVLAGEAAGAGGRGPKALPALAVANIINSSTGADGASVNYRQPLPGPFGKSGAIRGLIEDLNSGRVKRVLIHGLNPLYCCPEKEALLAALRKAELVAYTGDRVDETGSHAHYIIPDSHDLEKWGDWEFKKGIFSVAQPAIRPLYNTRCFEDSLIAWMSGRQTPGKPPKSFYQHVKSRWEQEKGPLFWNRFLARGVYGAEAFLPAPPRRIRPSVLEAIPAFSESPLSPPDLELCLYETSGLKQGKLANVSWLQEFPDPVTKICWGNYISISPSLAFQRNLKEGEVLKITSGKRRLEAPLHIQPGLNGNTLALALGFGRSHCGQVGRNVGVSAWPLVRMAQKGESAFDQHFGAPVSFERTGRRVPLAQTQGHHSMEGRDIILEARLPDFLRDPSSGIHKGHKAVSLWAEHKYPGHKWGMAIDLNVCNGCGACMLACQSENNIPVVGKQNVLEGREMHWIRVDRYYEGAPENPRSVHQPVVCMHCDNAPCETVCPVMATVHSSEGTNDMIYNRCVGTRYCSNNCPYKVRRFNWFNYEKNIKKPLDMALNPEVTVRSRGVMEKCTFCIQRVQKGKRQAKLAGRPLKDNEIQTACQESCPAEAIVFGDLNDPKSKVKKAFSAPNSYALLDDMLNTKPSVRYQTKVRALAEGEAKAPYGKKSGH